MNKTRSCNYSLDAPDDEYSPKHVEQPSNKGISYPTQLHLVGHFIRTEKSYLLKCIGPFRDRPCIDVFLTVSFYVYGELAGYNSVEVCVKYL